MQRRCKQVFIPAEKVLRIDIGRKKTEWNEKRNEEEVFQNRIFLIWDDQRISRV